MSILGKWFGFDTEEVCEEGFAALDRKDFEVATEAFELCAAESDRESTVRLARFHLAECYTQLANADFHRAKYERARSQIERALAYAVPTAERHLLAARIARRLEDPAEAAHHLDSALANTPDHPQALALQTASWYEQGRVEEALVRSERLPAGDNRVERFHEAHRHGNPSEAVAQLLAFAAQTDERPTSSRSSRYLG